jgi:copper chaperone CopZ
LFVEMSVATTDSSREEDRIDRQGFLIKQGRVVKNWMKRWFVLRGSKLYYYKNQRDSQELGMLLLSTECRILDGQKKAGKRNCLEIRTPERDFFVYSDISEDDIETWKRALEQACAASQPLHAASKQPTIELYIRGMMCECCVEQIKAAVEKLKGFQSIQLDLEEERATVVGKVDAQLLVSTLEEAGFLPAIFAGA